MKIVVLFTLAIALMPCCTSTTTLFLVRHSEKTDNSRDPDLNPAGVIRSNRLVDVLKNDHIGRIYSTNFKRTRQTAQPLSDKLQIPILLYSPDTLQAFAYVLKKQKTNTLVIGHSNSTISLLDALGLSHNIKLIEDSDYSNLFKVTVKGKTPKLKLKELKY